MKFEKDRLVDDVARQVDDPRVVVVKSEDTIGNIRLQQLRSIVVNLEVLDERAVLALIVCD